jgi:hypothetical protein
MDLKERGCKRVRRRILPQNCVEGQGLVTAVLNLRFVIAESKLLTRIRL